MGIGNYLARSVGLNLSRAGTAAHKAYQAADPQLYGLIRTAQRGAGVKKRFTPMDILGPVDSMGQRWTAGGNARYLNRLASRARQATLDEAAGRSPKNWMGRDPRRRWEQATTGLSNNDRRRAQLLLTQTPVNGVNATQAIHQARVPLVGGMAVGATVMNPWWYGSAAVAPGLASNQLAPGVDKPQSLSDTLKGLALSADGSYRGLMGKLGDQVGDNAAGRWIKDSPYLAGLAGLATAGGLGYAAFGGDDQPRFLQPGYSFR